MACELRAQKSLKSYAPGTVSQRVWRGKVRSRDMNLFEKDEEDPGRREGSRRPKYIKSFETQQSKTNVLHAFNHS